MHSSFFPTQALTVPGLSTHITNKYIENVGLVSHLAAVEIETQGGRTSPKLHLSAPALLRAAESMDP